MSRRVFRIQRLLRWAAIGALATAAMAAPTSQPANHPVRPAVESLTSQGVAALSAQDSRASLDAFMDAIQDFLRTDKQITALDPLRVQAQHGLAVAYLQEGRFDKAGEIFKTGDLLDKVMNTPTAPRSLVINRTVLDLTQKFNVMRSIKSLKDFLTVHPENDEQVLNLLGTALDRASYDERFSKGVLYEQANKFYDTESAKLEKTRAGERRWGIEWVSEKEFTARSKDRQEYLDAYDKAAKKLDDAISQQSAADADVNTQRSRAKFAKSNNLGRAQSRLQEATQLVATCQRDADEKKAALPHFPWLTNPNAVLPDSGGALLAIATPKKPAEAGKAGSIDGTPKDPPKKHPKKDPVAVHTDPPAENPPIETPPIATDPPAAADPVPPEVPADKPTKTVKAQFNRTAAAFPVGPDLFITTKAAIDQASSITLSDAQDNNFTAEFVRSDDKTGLALVRVAGKKFNYLNAADKFAGGEIRCTGFPTVSVFAATPESLPGRSSPMKPGDSGAWVLAFTTNPRLGGAPVTTADGMLVGVVMAQRDSSPQQVPAVRLDDLRTFLGSDLPTAMSAKTDPPYVVMLTATVSK